MIKTVTIVYLIGSIGGSHFQRDTVEYGSILLERMPNMMICENVKKSFEVKLDNQRIIHNIECKEYTTMVDTTVENK